jgi:hypothetical protein
MIKKIIPHCFVKVSFLIISRSLISLVFLRKGEYLDIAKERIKDNTLYEAEQGVI